MDVWLKDQECQARRQGTYNSAKLPCLTAKKKISHKEPTPSVTHPKVLALLLTSNTNCAKQQQTTALLVKHPQRIPPLKAVCDVVQKAPLGPLLRSLPRNGQRATICLWLLPYSKITCLKMISLKTFTLVRGHQPLTSNLFFQTCALGKSYFTNCTLVSKQVHA